MLKRMCTAPGFADDDSDDVKKMSKMLSFPYFNIFIL